MPTQSIDERFSAADVFIHNAMVAPDIREAFARAGRDEAYFQEGQTLLTNARRLHERQQAEYGDQYEATDDLYEARNAADDAYMRHMQLARIAFTDDPSAQKALLLTGRRKGSHAGWIDQATTFYNNLLESDEMKARITSFGVSPTELEATQTAVGRVAELRRIQLNRTGEAQEATRHRDAALDVLAGWMSENKALARVLMADQPQQLEKLGMLARSD